MSKNLSIADIAKTLKISKTTVSFILNGKAREKRISDELVERVQKLVKELNYKPNSLARSLRTGKSNIIGLMVDDISDPFFAGIARLIEDKAHERGFSIIYCSTGNDLNKARQLINMLRNCYVDGFLISGPAGMENEIIELEKSGLPVVTFGRQSQKDAGPAANKKVLAVDLIDSILVKLGADISATQQ